MSARAVIVDGDRLDFDPMFGHRKVSVLAPPTAIIRGSGVAIIGGKKICVRGDEGKVTVKASYQIPGYEPGMGELTIMLLAPDQFRPATTGMAPLIVKGSSFQAQFRPTKPAMMINPPKTPDPMAPTVATGRFVASQVFVEAA